MISIILPVFNSEKYIKRCLDSLVNQTYKDLEIIIINDGSTDNTLKICKGYNDDRIKIINKKCKNISLVRNVGLDIFKGDYVYFIDSDDYIEKDTIEYLYNLCESNNVSMATTKCLDIYNYDFKVKNDKEKITLLSSEDYMKRVLLSTNREVAIWNKLIKRDVIKDLRFYDRIITDILFTYRVVLNVDKVIFSNQIKYFYFNHGNSYSHSKNDNYDRIKDMYRAYLERYNDIKKIYPKMIENEASILWLIPRRYLSSNKDIIKYLNKNGAVKLFNKLFSFKVLKCNLGFKEKIKIVLFRISPKLHNMVMHNYIKRVVKR